MTNFPSRGLSYWIDSAPKTTYPMLKDDIEVDVAIVGGGIAGLSAAYMLKQQGKTVAVLEKETLGSMITGYTTGKVTSQHGLNYTEVKKKFGADAAKIYAQANETAIQQIEKVIQKEKIDCDWQRDDNYVFTQKPDEVEKLQQEVQDAQEVGLPASFVTETPLPFAVEGAVKFTNQAKFHSVKYIQGLAKAVEGGGSYIFEHSKVSNIQDGEICHMKAGQGKVKARDVIIATNVPTPVLDHTIYAAKEYPTRSYIVAGKLKGDLPGMYITTGSPSRSIQPFVIDGEKWLLIGGEGHVGTVGGPSKLRYDRLVRYAKENFDVDATYKWSTWDYVPYDHMPLVGKLYPWSKHVYTATGFKKWGLSTSMVSAMILTNQIMGKQNPWAHTFRSNRSSAITSMPKGLAQAFGLMK